MSARKVEAIVLCLVSLTAFQASLHTANPVISSEKVPAPIYEGPWNISQSSLGDPYWYQTGAMGTSNSSFSYNYVAASVTIRTVYDKVNNDAHSYWVGGFIANGAFVQVGFLNEVSTSNQPFCCAWFYEYFYPSSSPLSSCCPPVIGREGSVGPIGSWHNYTLASNGSGIWSFYVDGLKVGTTQDLGGTAAGNSGQYAPAALAEVAQASSNTDVIGPGEFKNMSYRTSGSAWQKVPRANSFIWYGKGSFSNGNPPPNPYGAREIEGIDNDFLAGSYIPPLDLPSQRPGSLLWPYPPPYSCCMTLTFLDDRNFTFQPDWVSLQSNTGAMIFLTQYENHQIQDGTWTLKMVKWHSADIWHNQTSPSSSFTYPGTNSQIFHPDVFSIRLHVQGIVSGLPVRGASVSTNFPDTASEGVKTDDSGNTVLLQLPADLYVVRITVPFGIPAILTQNVTQPDQLTARVFATLEVALIAGLPISAAVLILIIAVSKERRQRASMPTIPPSIMIGAYCPSCGQPFHQSQMYCTNCGTRLQLPPT